MLSLILLGNRLQEGGPAMYIILLVFLLSLIFVVIAFVKRRKDSLVAQKMINLAVECSLIALVVGFLASVVGIIQLFDMVEALGDVNPALFSGGLKGIFTHYYIWAVCIHGSTYWYFDL